MAHTLSNLSSGDTASKSENLLSNLSVESSISLSAHQRVPETVSSTDDLDLIHKLSPVDWNVNTSEVHVSGEDFISEDVVTPKSAVRVGLVFTVSQGDIDEVSKHDVHSIVLLQGIVAMLSVSVNSVVSDHVLHQEECVVVWVLSSWSIKEDTDIGVVHLVISHHEKGWNVDTFVSSSSLADGFLTNAGQTITDLLYEGVVVDVSSSNNNDVVSEVVGSSEVNELVSGQFSNSVWVSSNWLSHLMVSEGVVVNSLHGGSLHVLGPSIIKGLNLHLSKLKLSRVEGGRAERVSQDLDGTADITSHAVHVEAGDLTVNRGLERSSHALNFLSEGSLSVASRSSGQHGGEEVSSSSGSVVVITGSSADIYSKTCGCCTCFLSANSNSIWESSGLIWAVELEGFWNLATWKVSVVGSGWGT